jgi:hypothetical protein
MLIRLIGLVARQVDRVNGVARRIAKCLLHLHLRFDDCRPAAMPPYFNDERPRCISQ